MSGMTTEQFTEWKRARGLLKQVKPWRVCARCGKTDRDVVFATPRAKVCDWCIVERRRSYKRGRKA